MTRRDGLRVTTIERTLFDIAATGADIRHLAQEALAKRLTTRAKLQAMAERHRGERGAPALRRVAGEPHTRSDLERRFLRFLDDNGIPQPLWNEELGPFTVDCYWPQLRARRRGRRGRPPLDRFEEDRARTASGRRSARLRESFADE